MRYELRFFSEHHDDDDLVVIDAADADDRQDQIDALWDEDDRAQRFQAVEW